MLKLKKRKILIILVCYVKTFSKYFKIFLFLPRNKVFLVLSHLD
jgi:hypothetical protein